MITSFKDYRDKHSLSKELLRLKNKREIIKNNVLINPMGTSRLLKEFRNILLEEVNVESKILEDYLKTLTSI